MIIDALDKSIQTKIVYFGPALSGKTTTLLNLFDHFGKKDKVESIESTVKRTLFFDYGTISFQNDKWILKLHCYTTTGQDFYIVTRPITLRAIDGVIFVADSQRNAYERNLISWNELESYFGEAFIDLPKVIAFNKQDLSDKFNYAAFLEEIDYTKYKNLDVNFTIALNGEGILNSFEEILRLIFKDLYKSELVSTVH